MNLIARFLIAALFLTVSSAAFAQSNVELRIVLFPAGNFVAKTAKVIGRAELSGSEVFAKEIKVETGTFDSGVALRNKHMRQRFESDKFPFATLSDATGKDGKGKGKLTVKNITKDVEGSYKIVDDAFLEATFKAKASDFQIKDVAYMGVGMEDEVEVFVRVPVAKATGAPASNVKKPGAKTKKGKKGKT
jgi:hypothetical protein